PGKSPSSSVKRSEPRSGHCGNTSALLGTWGTGETTSIGHLKQIDTARTALWCPLPPDPGRRPACRSPRGGSAHLVTVRAHVRLAQVKPRSAVMARLALAETAARTATPCPLLLANHGRS